LPSVRVGQTPKALGTYLGRRSDANISFEQTRTLLSALGFEERVRGSHHMFVRDDIQELINLQEIEGGKCKPYQVRQMSEVILKYNLMREL
jgi:predicted RNA binding protein YcfA (HicA-like mRNA interferase family)